jgi:hypothetical protein
MRRCSRSALVVVVSCLIGVRLLAVPDTAECRKTAGPPRLEVYSLPTGTGGGVVYDMTMDRRSKIYAAGQTWDYGAAPVACVWKYIEDCSAGCAYEELPSLDATKAAAAKDITSIIEITGEGPDTSLVAVGYSYDSLNRIHPMWWVRDVSGDVWTYQELPTLAGAEGSAVGKVWWPTHPDDEDLTAFGWSEGVATDKAVIWTDNGSGGWAIRTLPHNGPGYAGCVLDGKGGDAADTLLCGWTESALADTVPVVWQNSGGGWTKTELPMLSGGTQGMAHSIVNHQGPNMLVVGESENSLGERRAVRWYYDGGWQVEALDQLAAFSQSVGILGQQGNDLVILGKSYDPGAPVGTIWGIVDDYTRNDFVYDINDLILTDLAPTIREAVSMTVTPVDVAYIVANGVDNQLGGYGVTQSSTPGAYVLVETDVVPATSYGGVTILIAVLGALGALLLIRRRRGALALDA